MSSWNHFIKRICKQDAVYWGTPQNNGYGGITHAAPVEIKVRWEEDIERKGEKSVREEDIPKTRANAKIICPDALSIDGYLFLGTLADITGDNTNPVNVEGAWRIYGRTFTSTLNHKGQINESFL